MDILSTVDKYEITQISDALGIKRVSKDTDIIKQGEQGDIFYILEEGKAYAHKVLEGQSKLNY